MKNFCQVVKSTIFLYQIIVIRIRNKRLEFQNSGGGIYTVYIYCVYTLCACVCMSVCNPIRKLNVMSHVIAFLW